MIVQRGYRPAGNFHTARLQAAPLGHFFHVMTQRLRRDAGLFGAGCAAGSLGDRRVHQGAAVEPERDAGRCCRRARRLSRSRASPKHEGLPTNFADEWTLPPTAVYGTPDNGHMVFPARSCRRTGNGCTSARSAAPAASASRTNRTEAVTSEASERRLKRMSSGHEHTRGTAAPRPPRAAGAAGIAGCAGDCLTAWRTRALIVAAVARAAVVCLSPSRTRARTTSFAPT